MKEFFYISGSLGLHLLINVISTLLIYRYDPGMPNDNNLPLLVSSAWIGMAQLVGRTIGAFAQPAIGYFSDGFWSRWGKRRPFIALGTLPVIVSFILIFMPSLNYGSTGNLIYVMLLLSLFYVSFAIYYIPYLAWLPTLAPTSEQTITLSTLMAVSSLVGTALGGVIAPWLTSALSFDKMGLILGGISLLTLLMPLAIAETPGQSPRLNKAQESHKNTTFWYSCQTVWRTHSLRSHMLGFSLIWIAVTMLTGCTTYIAVAILNRDLGFGGVLNGIFLGGVAIAFPIIIALAKRWGKKEALETAMIWSGLGLIILGLWSILVGKGLSIWLMLLFFSSFGWAAFFILPNAILPDLVRQTLGIAGAQREAVYFGIRGFLAEISVGIGSLLTGLILTLGKTPERPWGIQIALVVAGLFALASVKAFTSGNPLVTS
jgi:glycoside/pentoside/hexuronide:cation symporter, GPH family